MFFFTYIFGQFATPIIWVSVLTLLGVGGCSLYKWKVKREARTELITELQEQADASLEVANEIYEDNEEIIDDGNREIERKSTLEEKHKKFIEVMRSFK